MNKGPQSAIKTLRLSLNDLKAHVKPAFWFNENICFYRMERILSLNNNLTLPSTTDDDYYYPVSDILLFKDYNSYLNGDLSDSNNTNNNTGNNTNNAGNNTNNAGNNTNNAGNNTNNAGNNTNNAGNNTNNAGNNIIEGPSSSAPSMVEMVEESLGEITLGDNKVNDYNQPGVEGLKIMVKNGKKPLAYSPNPSCIIPGDNGNNLFVQPLAPEGYVCLGCVCTVSVRPTPPNVNNCPIRCVPISCLDELQITLADDIKLSSIKLPYHLFQVSDGKFVKGTMDIPNQTGIHIKSYEMKDICDNTELDDNDNPITIKLHYKNTDITGQRPAQSKLLSNQFNGIKGYFNREFENFLVNKPEIQLNDYPNNPPNQMLKPSGKRYLINSRSNNDDKVQLFLSLNKRIGIQSINWCGYTKSISIYD